MNYYTLCSYQDGKRRMDYKKSGGDLSRFVCYNLDYLKVDEKNKVTKPFELIAYSTKKMYDLLSGPDIFKGLIVSDKLKNILLEHSLPENQSIPLKITHKKILYTNYSYLHIVQVSEVPSPVITSKTEFYRLKDERQKDGPFNFKSIDEANKNNCFLVEGGQLYLSDNASNFDLIRFRGISWYGVIISKKLRDRLVDEKITGCDIKEAPWIH